MNLQHPLGVITPTLDGDVLVVLARADKGFTGREIERAIPGASHSGVQHALRRLTRQGIVLSERAGRANLFQLNRRHLAASMIEALSLLHQELVSRLQVKVKEWPHVPFVAVLFGSVARAASNEDSDIDILLVRPQGVDFDDDIWREQVAGLEEDTAAWTGNDARVLEYGYEELPGLIETETVIHDAAKEGIVLCGSRSSLGLRKMRQA
jgi:predicted nucleotidyltransferase